MAVRRQMVNGSGDKISIYSENNEPTNVHKMQDLFLRGLTRIEQKSQKQMKSKSGQVTQFPTQPNIKKRTRQNRYTVRTFHTL